VSPGVNLNTGLRRGSKFSILGRKMYVSLYHSNEKTRLGMESQVDDKSTRPAHQVVFSILPIIGSEFDLEAKYLQHELMTIVTFIQCADYNKSP
jgi:hypothetical protein